MPAVAVFAQQTLNTEGIHPLLNAGRSRRRVVVVVVVDGDFLAAEIGGLLRGNRVAAAACRGGGEGALGLTAPGATPGAAPSTAPGAVAPPLRLPVSAQRLDVHLDALERQLLLLLLERLEDFSLLAILLLAQKFVVRNRLAAARLRVRVVRRPARALLRVVLLAPLGPPVLVPNLNNTHQFICEYNFM